MMKKALAVMGLVVVLAPVAASASTDLLDQIEQLVAAQRHYSLVSEETIAAGGIQIARSGCCSHHGGVAGCDSATGHARCADGSDSPSCGC